MPKTKSMRLRCSSRGRHYAEARTSGARPSQLADRRRFVASATTSLRQRIGGRLVHFSAPVTLALSQLGGDGNPNISCPPGRLRCNLLPMNHEHFSSFGSAQNHRGHGGPGRGCQSAPSPATRRKTPGVRSSKATSATPFPPGATAACSMPARTSRPR